jgi:flagellar hook-associated protein 1 FlgK
MSLFSVLGVGNSALNSAQIALDVTSQNIANADVDGYSRKRVNQVASYRQDARFGEMGMGVDLINIERIRSAQVDLQIRTQNEQVGFYETLDFALENVENILNEPSETGIQAFLDDFFDSWDNLANNPADLAARTMVKTQGEMLTGVFTNISSELSNLKAAQNDEMVSIVEKINNMSAEIYNLNNEIAKVELGNQNANDSRDRRDFLIKDLSKLIDLDIFEADDGQITVTTSGNILISPVSVNEIEIYESAATRDNTKAYNQYTIRMKSSRNPITPKGGELKGVMVARDEAIPKFESWIDTLAVGLVEKINDQHKSGYNINGYTGFNFFDPTTTGADDIAISASIMSDVNNIAAAKGTNSTDAIPNTLVAGELDFGNSPVQLTKTLGRSWTAADTNQEKATNIAVGSVVAKLNGSGSTLKEGVDYSINYIQGTIQMLHNGYDSTAIDVEFNYETGGFPGPGNNANAIEIASLRDALTMSEDFNGNGTASFTDFYAAAIAELGLDRSSSISNLETRKYLLEQYETTQDSIAGVSIDEEMSNLVKFQNSYKSAARIITTAQAMLDVLMNL